MCVLTHWYQHFLCSRCGVTSLMAWRELILHISSLRSDSKADRSWRHWADSSSALMHPPCLLSVHLGFLPKERTLSDFFFWWGNGRVQHPVLLRAYIQLPTQGSLPESIWAVENRNWFCCRQSKHPTSCTIALLPEFLFENLISSRFYLKTIFQ